MKLLYPDPRRRCPRFELPGSAGAGPQHKTKTMCQMGNKAMKIKLANTLEGRRERKEKKRKKE